MILKINRTCGSANAAATSTPLAVGATVTAVEAVHRASDRRAVIDADLKSANGRSQWFWVRLNNGDILMACYPQGDTYAATAANRSV